MTESDIQTGIFVEKLRASWPGYLPLLLIAPAVGFVALPFLGMDQSFLVGALVTAMAIAVRAAWNRRLTVTTTEIVVGKDRITKSSVTSVSVIDRAQRQSAMGPGLNANALVSYQASAKQLVRIDLNQEKWPYLLVSTNKATQLVAAIKN